MNSSKIFDILKKFSSNNQRGILIDGSWGVGKTYQINRFLKEIKESNKECSKKYKVKVIYSSLFGVNSIEDLHTELYIKIHPKKNIAKHVLNAISPAFSLIPYVGETISNSVDYAIGNTSYGENSQKNNTAEKKASKRIIIILDDIERVKKGFDYSLLLGYINQLYLLGIKVVCVCDSSKIKDEEGNIHKFEELKEKIFDRYYKITKTDDEIIKMYFDEHSSNIDEKLVNVFENNLRMASKASFFYNEMKQHMNSLDSNKYNKLDEYALIWYSSLILTHINSSNMNIKENEEDAYEYFYYTFKDKNIAANLAEALGKDTNSIIDEKKFSKRMLFVSITFAYLYDDYSYFDEFLIKQNTSSEREIHLFYLSAKERLSEIKKIIESSKNETEPLKEKELERIISMFDFKELNNVEYDENEYETAIAKRMIGADERTIKSLSFPESYTTNVNVKKFLNNVRQNYKRILVNNEIEEIKHIFETKELNNMIKALNQIEQKPLFWKSENNKYDLIDEIKDLFKKNNYFFPNLKGRINENEWELSYRICSFFIKYDSRKD